MTERRMILADLDPAERIIRLARERYVDGTIDVEHFEGVVETVLRGGAIAVLQPGEWIVPMGGNA